MLLILFLQSSVFKDRLVPLGRQRREEKGVEAPSPPSCSHSGGLAVILMHKIG